MATTIENTPTTEPVKAEAEVKAEAPSLTEEVAKKAMQIGKFCCMLVVNILSLSGKI